MIMINFKKYIPIHGIKFNKPFSLTIPINCISPNILMYNDNNYVDSIKFLTYSDYLNIESIINKNDIKECDSIAEFTSLSNNTIEVENLKIILSAIYFADRMSNTHERKSKFIKSMSHLYVTSDEDKEKAINYIDELYTKTKNEFFDLYNVAGYRNNNDIFESLYWYISLGNLKVTNDNFDKFITRGFSSNLNCEYMRQNKFEANTIHVNVNDTFMDYLISILKRLHDTDEYSKKIKSALRLYYSVLYESNIEQAILTYSSILETLLLSGSESEKSRVANRCACITANNMKKSDKTFIANQISYFYNYRNAIIHDGQSYLEIDAESISTWILRSIRHLIYFIIKYIITNEIKDISAIKKLVKTNLKDDGITNCNTGYITYSKEKPDTIPLIYDDY